MSRYPSEDVERFDSQFSETEEERNDRLREKRRQRLRDRAFDLGVLPTELPGSEDNGG